MRTPRRGRRDRGGALLVAVVMLFIMVAMMELMLSAPNSELVKVRSTVAKEHSMASADAGLRDAITWVNANYQNLSSFLDDPSSGTLAVGKKIVLTSQSPNSGAGGATSFTLASSGSYADQLGPLTETNGVYSFPVFVDSQSIGNTNNNFLRFGDPVISRGEYAYRIASLGNGYYQVDIEGRAQGLTAAAAGQTAKFVSRITAVLYKAPPFTGTMPGTICWAGPGAVNANFYNPSTSPATSTNVGSQTWASTASLVLYDDNSTGGGHPVASGADQNGGTAGTSALAVQGSAVSMSGSGGQTIDQSLSPGTSAQGYISASTTPDSISATDPIWTNINSLVDTTKAAGNFDGTNWGTANTNGTQGSPNSTTGAPSLQTAGLAHYTYSQTLTTQGAGTPNYTKTVDPSLMNGMVYLRIPGSAIVDTNTALITVNGSSVAPAGLLIIDIEAGATFTGTGEWLYDHGNPSAVSGAVIVWQRGRINLPQTNKLGWIYSNGSAPHGAEYNSQAVNKALNAVVTPVKLVSYVVIQ